LLIAKSFSQINLLPDTSGFCAGDSAFIKIDKIEKNAAIRWTTPYAVIENTKRVQVFQNGKYFVRVSMGGKTITDSTYIKIYPKPKLKLRDTIACKGRSVVLDTKVSGMKYLWSTDETTQKIKAENSGRYWVKVMNQGCAVFDTVNVKYLPGTTLNFSNEMTFCFSDQNKVLSVKAVAGTKILWSTGSIYPSINVQKEGIYWVKTDNKNCGEQTDSVKVYFKACDCEMIIPNSFTPNEDNRNDYFFPVLQCEYSYFNMIISDKWGNIVFSSNNPHAKWDGRFKGNLCPEEVYVYRIESIERGSDKKNLRSGNVSLFR
jgi:gliding motility-associated-like protein